MRNPKRIDEMMTVLTRFWKKHPDWRFGQLILNFDDMFLEDLFYIEDDVLMAYLKEFEKMLDK